MVSPLHQLTLRSIDQFQNARGQQTGCHTEVCTQAFTVHESMESYVHSFDFLLFWTNICRFLSMLAMRNNRGSSGRSCAVLKCHNNWRKLKKWKLTECEIHSPLTHEACSCEKPYSLHMFPGGTECEGIVNNVHFL